LVIQNIVRKHRGENREGKCVPCDLIVTPFADWIVGTKIVTQLPVNMNFCRFVQFISDLVCFCVSRAVISEPDQNVHAQMSAGRRPRGSNRALHDSK